MKKYIAILVLVTSMPLRPANADLWGNDLPLLVQIVANTLNTMNELSRQSNMMREEMAGINDRIYRIQSIADVVQPSQWDRWKDPAEAMRRIQLIYHTLPKEYRSEKSDQIEEEISKAMNMISRVSSGANSSFRSGKEMERRGADASPGVAQKLTASGVGTLIALESQTQVIQSHIVSLLAQQVADGNEKESRMVTNRGQSFNSVSESLKGDKDEFILVARFGPQGDAVMKYALPAIEEYEKLLPVAKQIYLQTSALSWQMLLPLFLLSVAMGYSTDLGITGSILVRLKRLFLVALLLVAFPTIAEFFQVLGVEIAKSIDNMAGIDMVLEAASKRAESYSFDLQGLLNLGADLILGALVILSFLVLVAARFLLIAFQHFYWFLLIAIGPFLILANLFESASGVTKNLFKNMIQVSAWPIIWSILSAFLKVMPFASAYEGLGGFVTIITLNLIIAVALLLSPFIVSQLCEGVNLGIGDTLRNGAMRAVAYTNPKTAAIAAASQSKNVAQKGLQMARAKFEKPPHYPGSR